MRCVRRLRAVHLTACLVALLLPACGYHLMHAKRPLGVTSIAIVPFEELQPVGISADMALALSNALAAAGTETTTDEASANAILTGTLKVRTQPSATLRGVQLYALQAQVDATLTSAEGSLLWRGQNLWTEEFLPTADNQYAQPLVTESSRRAALLRLARRAAEGVAESLIGAASDAEVPP